MLLLVDQRAACWSSQEDLCLATIRGLRERGAGCVVAYSSYPAREVAEALLDEGATLEVASRAEFSLLRFCLHVRRLCRRHGVGLIHMRHYAPSALLSAALPLFAPCPILFGVCSSGEPRPKKALKRIAFHAFNRVMNWGIAHFIVPSHFVERRVVDSNGIAAGRVERIFNGIDLDRFRPRDPKPIREEIGVTPDQPLVLTAAHLIPPKAVDVLIRAFAAVLKEQPNAVLVVAGDGPERPRLEGLAAELNISPSVRFIGARSDLPELLSVSALFCCSSVWGEAFGLVNAEAMACGVPVVSTTTGAIPEVIEHGRCGLLVPPNDADATASAIMELLASPERRAAMGRAGRERAERLFDIRRTVDQYIALYERTASRARA